MATGTSEAAEARQQATARVLRVLADVAPDHRAIERDVSGSGSTRMAWLGTLQSETESGDPTSLPLAGPPDPGARSVSVDHSATLAALAHHDALTPETDDLRIGWLWAVAPSAPDRPKDRLVLPLLSRAATIIKSIGRWSVEPIGPWDLVALVDDATEALRLERSAAFGGGALDMSVNQELIHRLSKLRSWANDVTIAAGLGPAGQLLAPTDPSQLHTDSLKVVVGYGLYVEQVVDVGHPKETLRSWSRDPSATETALASLFVPERPAAPGFAPPPMPTDGADPIPSLPLNARQRDVVISARHAPVTVVSGPPGTGKSQTAAAVALDCVARGESVLVATRSPVAADVLAELLAQLPGPDPLLFGGGIRARKLAADLADGIGAPSDQGSASALHRARRTCDDLRAVITTELEDQEAAEQWSRQVLTVERHAALAPTLFESSDSSMGTEATALLERARYTTGLLATWRRKRALGALRDLCGSTGDAGIDALAAAVDVARLRARARRAQSRDPALSRRRLQALAAADAELRVATGRALASEVAERAHGDARRAVAALSVALRSGRSARRAHLNRVDVASLTDVLPLWVGTLGQIESLLPAEAAAFDVVILDEASQIDLMSASAALLRAKRAVVIGDPRQLRFVSFVADAAIAAAVGSHGAQDLADRLDVRRISAFDLAAGVAPVTMLDEHYRCVPHLIGFSAERFYDGRLQLVTRHPTNDDERAIEVRRVDGSRVNGVNVAEVEAAVELTRDLLEADPTTTIGIVSPYRDQVDAVEAELRSMDLAMLLSGRIRVGTVHGFQGAECDVVIVSFAIGGKADRGRGFLEDPNLFNVLISRARQRLIVLTSGNRPDTGLVADYLRWASTPPRPPVDQEPNDPWTATLTAALRDAGAVVRTGYPVGHWTIDLVVGDDRDALAVATRVHPDGSEAHIERALALTRAGWNQASAYATDHDGQAAVSALALIEQAESTDPPAPVS